jgi:histidyl-tRNA synthetase
VQKFYYCGPFFRYERPQIGRYRQFHQLGLEVIGDGSAAADIEIIDAFLSFMEKVGLKGLEVKINSVGCDECRPHYTETLKSFLGGCLSELCGDCKTRSEKNPLRVFDCKNSACNSLVEKAPRISDSLCSACAAHHEIVKSGLTRLGHSYICDPDLVRGLDYYTRTAFEVSCNRLGAQDAVGGGGRYDKLVKQLGGQSTPATGFAIGIERLMMLVSEQRKVEEDSGCKLKRAPVLFIAVDSDETRIEGLKLAARLRRGGAIVKMDHLSNKLGKQISRADKGAVDFVAVLGTRELEEEIVNLKDLSNGDQSEVSFDALIARFC